MVSGIQPWTLDVPLRHRGVVNDPVRSCSDSLQYLYGRWFVSFLQGSRGIDKVAEARRIILYYAHFCVSFTVGVSNPVRT